MSIVYTADVFCDGDDCSRWIHGCTEWEPPLKSAARREAARSKWQHIGGNDYCPICAKNLPDKKTVKTT